MATKESTDQRVAIYVYGIVPADVEAKADASGVGDPPGEITVVRSGDIAALVSEVATDKPLGRPEDLDAHAYVLDTTAAEMPVLPLRFGAVVRDEDAVVEELLDGNHDEFAAALRELEGKAEYVVRGRYVEATILREVLAESADASELREQVRYKSADAARNDRIALGEIVNNTIAEKRTADTRTVIATLEELGFGVNPMQQTHEMDAVHVACLAERAKQAELEEAVGRLAEEWEGRVDLRLLGPLAPYDFVTTTKTEA